jgi:hypothetical protein
MPVIKCPVKATCPDPAAPVTNFTSESADVEGFYGRNSWNQIAPPNPGQNWSPGALFGPVTCLSFNQQEADLCAGRRGPTDPNDPNSSPTTDPGGLPRHPAGPVKVFYSQRQSCVSFCPDGSPFNYVLAAGAFVRNSQILADRAANSYACKQARINRACLGSLVAACCVNAPFSGSITVTGGVTGATIVSGSLPTGLTMALVSGAIVISGTPTVAASFTFGIQAQLGSGATVTKNFTLCVIGILPAVLPGATPNTPYVAQLGLPCGTATAWTVIAGTLPTGLGLDPVTGLISGTPTGNGTSNFTVQVKASGVTCPQGFGITVGITKVGWKICNWNQVLPLLTGFGQCGASTFPAWDGIFDQEYGAFPFKLWYFIDQSINGSKAAASEAPDYPPIQVATSNDCFTQLIYHAFTGQWQLFIACADLCGTTEIWNGTLTNNNPDNPSGVYVNDGLGTSGPTPATIEIEATTFACCGDVGVPVPANWSNPQPARIRVHNYGSVLAALGVCAGCDASGNPAWDGTLPVQLNNVPFNALLWFPAGTTGAYNTSVIPALSVAGKQITNGITVGIFISVQFVGGVRWRFQIRCVATGQPGNQLLIWEGSKTVGNDPTGTYVALSGSQTGANLGCLTIESF